MTELEELYGFAESLEKKGINVDDIRNQIRQREEKYLNEEAIPAIAQKIEEMLAPVKRDVILVAEYREGFPVSIKMGKKVSDGPVKETERESVEVPVPEEETPTEESVDEDDNPSEITDEDLPEESEAKHTKGPRKSFKVILNGKEIMGADGAGILVETIRQIGYERVAALNIMFVKGAYNLVDKRKRTDQGKLWQRQSGEWYIYTNTSNPTKAENLAEIAERLGIDMEITLEGERFYPKE